MDPLLKALVVMGVSGIALSVLSGGATMIAVALHGFGSCGPQPLAALLPIGLTMWAASGWLITWREHVLKKGLKTSPAKDDTTPDLL
jgi:hypothetical protein